MNHSIYSADRPTHTKIVAVALAAGIGIAGFGIAVRINSDDGYSQTAHSPTPSGACAVLPKVAFSGVHSGQLVEADRSRLGVWVEPDTA